jgi:hypothetical protein
MEFMKAVLPEGVFHRHYAAATRRGRWVSTKKFTAPPVGIVASARAASCTPDRAEVIPFEILLA